jgi:hypothetical protein
MQRRNLSDRGRYLSSQIATINQDRAIGYEKSP